MPDEDPGVRIFLDDIPLNPSWEQRHMGEFPRVRTGRLRPLPQELVLDEPGRDRVKVRVQDTVWEGVVQSIEMHDSIENFSPEISIRIAVDPQPRSKKKPKKEIKMKYTAELIRDPRTKSVNIYLQLTDSGKYVSDGKEMEREEGAEMPLYLKMPEEKFDAIMKAAGAML